MPGRLSEAYTLELAEEHVGKLFGQVNVLGEALTQDDTDLVPNTPAAGNIQYSATGQQKYASSDGNAYNTGRLTLPATGGLTLTTGLQTIPGLTCTLAVGTWHVRGLLLLHNPATAGQGAPSIQLTASGGLTAANGRFVCYEVHAANGVGVADGTGLGGLLTGAAPSTGGANQVWNFDGIFVITVAGTLAVQMKQAATAASDILQYPSYLEVFPVT